MHWSGDRYGWNTYAQPSFHNFILGAIWRVTVTNLEPLILPKICDILTCMFKRRKKMRYRNLDFDNSAAIHKEFHQKISFKFLCLKPLIALENIKTY